MVVNNMVIRNEDLPSTIPPLTTYYAYLTGGCNLACQHCWITPTYQPYGDTGGHLDFNLFGCAIEEGIPLGLKSVKLTGGEPLLHPDFIRIVDLIKEKELGMTIETNGTLMNAQIAAHLREKSTLRHISVSLDGASPATHDSFRGVKGSFEKTTQGIRYLAEVGIHPQVIMSIHSGNVSEIEPLVNLVEGIGASSVKFNIIQSAGRGGGLAKRGKLLDIRGLIQVGSWIESKLQKMVNIPLFYGWPIAFHSLNRLMNSDGVCTILNILGILPDGQLAMCGIGREVEDLTYGLIGKDSIHDIWFYNQTLLGLRIKIPSELEDVCSMCLFKENCFGSCIAENYFSNNRLTAPFWFCQSAFDKGLFPETRLQLIKDN